MSGGFRQAIQPLADFLHISRIEAVDLRFDEAGLYQGYDSTFPTTRSGGKPEVVARLKRELNAVQTVMVGDGVSDLEAKTEVNQFIGFGRYVTRAPVKKAADAFIISLDELLRML